MNIGGDGPLDDAAARLAALAGLKETLRARDEELARAKEQLADRDRALAEISHRLYNGLQLITSFLRFEGRRLTDGRAKGALESASHRIEAMGHFHRKLGISDARPVDFAEYLGSFVQEIGASMGLSVKLRTEPTPLDNRTAADLAIVINELMMNAAKHAYGGRRGTVEIACGPSDGGVRVVVRDFGPGLPAHTENPHSLGMMLVRSIMKKRGGRLEVENRGGACFVLTLPRSS